MSEQSNRLKQDRRKILQAFAAASSVPAAEKPAPHLTLWSMLGLSIILTMLPFQVAMAFFSFTSILTFTICLTLAIKGHAQFSKPASALIAALVLTSVLSGCGPVLFTENLPDMFGLERRTDLKVYTITRFGMFGLGLNDATAEQAQLEGDIENIVAVKIDRGYGLLSMARVSVAGK